MTFHAYYFWHYLFSTPIVTGAGVTILLATISQVLGIVLGTITALARLSTIQVGRRFLLIAGIAAFWAWKAQPLLDGQFNHWWLLHLGPNPQGGAELWLTWILALFAAIWFSGGVIGWAFPSSPRIIRWITGPKWYPFRTIAGFYIWLFRGTPLLVQLFFVYFALPGMPGHLILNEFNSALVALSLNEGAYMAEIVRAGITAVDAGQTEAALSVGMTRGKAMRRIVLPQAIRVIIPPTGNEYISMLKNTSLAYAISVAELFYQEEQIRAATFQSASLLPVLAAWYLAMTSVLTIGQVYVERHFSRGFQRERGETFLDSFANNFFPVAGMSRFFLPGRGSGR